MTDYNKITDLAIAAALAQNWDEAIAHNKELLQENAENVAALNRLAYAYLKSSDVETAKLTYKKVLKIDKYNPIAVKNLKLLEYVHKDDLTHMTHAVPSPTVFLEEPGKTKTVVLVNPAPFRTLANVMTAQRVEMHPKKRCIEVRDTKGTYLGALPDDLSFRLHQFIDAGNTYEVYVKNIQKNTISVFIIERIRSKKFLNIPSFAISSSNSHGKASTTSADEDEDVSEIEPE